MRIWSVDSDRLMSAEFASRFTKVDLVPMKKQQKKANFSQKLPVVATLEAKSAAGSKWRYPGFNCRKFLRRHPPLSFWTVAAVPLSSTNDSDLGEGRSKLRDEEQDQPCTLAGSLSQRKKVLELIRTGSIGTMRIQGHESLSEAQLLWKRSKPPQFPTRYNLTRFAITMNELTPGLMARSMQEKGWKPHWFVKDKGSETYRYIGGYWEAREHGNWEACHDVFG